VVDIVKHIFPPDEVVIEDALPFRFDTVSRIRKVKSPVFVSHGRHDRIAPYAMSKVIETATTAPLKRFDIEKAGHNDLFAVGGDELWTHIREFVDTL